jgi:DNA-directed RNA polymerase subunit RPC12/RpoP
MATRCSRCRKEFTEEETKGATCCPGCGSKSVPMDTDRDVIIKINTHELRILGIWAENYAVSVDNQPANMDNPAYEPLKDTVTGICAHLREQLKALGKDSPLTLSHEMGDLRKEYPKAQLFRSGQEEV